MSFYVTYASPTVHSNNMAVLMLFQYYWKKTAQRTWELLMFKVLGLGQGSPTWCPRVPSCPHGPRESPVGLLWQKHKHDQCLHIDEYLYFSLMITIEKNWAKFYFRNVDRGSSSPPPNNTIVILAEYAAPKTTRSVSLEKTKIPMMSLK